MAISFSRSNPDHAQTGAAPLTGNPITICAWIYITQVLGSGTGNQRAFGIKAPTGSEKIMIGIFDSAVLANCDVRLVANDGTTNVGLTYGSGTGGIPPENTWIHLAAIDNGTSRNLFYNGGNKQTNSTSLTYTGSINATTIGAEAQNFNSFDGAVAEPAIWNTILTDTEIAILAKGYSPLLIRPSNLVFYAPMVRGV